MHHFLLLGAGALAAFTASAAPAFGAVLETRKAALAAAFPGAEVTRVVSFLTEEQMARAGERAGDDLDSAMVIHYRAHDQEGRLQGTAWLDAHLVRSQQEVLMIVLEPEGTVREIRVLAFLEPQEYLPPERWLRQFEGEALGPELRLRRKIQGITGASLTARAVTDAVRRVLALHQILGDSEESGALKTKTDVTQDPQTAPADEPDPR